MNQQPIENITPNRNKLVKSYGFVEQIASNENFPKESLKLAAKITGSDIAYISLLDDQKQYILSQSKSLLSTIKVEETICQYTIKENYVLEIEDTCERIASKKFNPTSLFIVCGNLLRVMSNIEMGNYQLIPHLINTGKYFFKKRDRLFEMELCFLNGINKLKPYYSAPQKKRLFMKLYEEINSKIVVSGGIIIDKKIDLIKWMRQKSEQ